MRTFDFLGFSNNASLWVFADLLDLNNDPTFQKVCPKTRIVDPVDFLEAVEEWEAGGATSEETGDA